MLEPPPPAPPSRTKIIVGRLLAGAIPPILATVAGLWQLLRPYMPHEHVGMLYIAMVACWIAPMALWNWCKVDSARADAKTDADAASAERSQLEDRLSSLEKTVVGNQDAILAQLGVIHRSVKGLHGRLDRADDNHEGLSEHVDNLAAQIAHLRGLALGVDVPAPNGQRVGPRLVP